MRTRTSYKEAPFAGLPDVLWALVVQRLALRPAGALACVFAPLIATPINQASRLDRLSRRRRLRRQAGYDRASSVRAQTRMKSQL